MKYIVRIGLIALLVAASVLIATADNSVKDVVYVSAENGGTLFLNALHQPGNTFCFKPEIDQEYNVALISKKDRQNILVSYNGIISVSSPEGADLGLEVKGISTQKSFELCDSK